MSVGRPALSAVVLDEAILVEAGQRHVKPDRPTEEPNDDTGLVARRAPPRTRLDSDEAGPVRGPVGGVRDERKAGLDRYRKAVLALDPDHVVILSRSSGR